MKYTSLICDFHLWSSATSPQDVNTIILSSSHVLTRSTTGQLCLKSHPTDIPTRGLRQSISVIRALVTPNTPPWTLTLQNTSQWLRPSFNKAPSATTLSVEVRTRVQFSSLAERDENPVPSFWGETTHHRTITCAVWGTLLLVSPTEDMLSWSWELLVKQMVPDLQHAGEDVPLDKGHPGACFPLRVTILFQSHWTKSAPI